MSARCPVCSHASRAAIEQAILNGKPKAQVAKTFGFTYTRSKDNAVVGNHKVIANHLDHMGEAFRETMEGRELASGEAMAVRLRVLEAEVDKVIERANKGEPVMVGDVPLLHDDGSPVMRYDNRLLLAAISQARANVELIAKLAGKVEADPTDTESVRQHLRSPEARRLLARLDELAAQQEG
jgi:ribosomal protein S28E/S33